jgi:hypothetical protein
MARPDRERPHQRGVAAEIKDAITLRAFLLVCGVGLLQLAFIASYIGAFHDPRPHQVPVSVVAPPSVASRVTGQLNALPGDPLQASPVSSRAAGVADLRDRTSYGVLEVQPAAAADRLILASASGPSAAVAVTNILRAVEQHAGRRLAVSDIRRPARGDHAGLSAFYLIVGWMIGGYLVAALLGTSSGARPANLVRATVRLAGIAVYAIITSLLGTLIVGAWVHALPSQLIGLWWLGAFVVFAAGAFTTALIVLAGTMGIGLAIALFVVLGNPSAGGAYVWPLLPAFWRSIGPWLLPGAGVDAARAIAYFGGANITTDLLVISGYAAAGLGVTYLVMFLIGRPLMPATASPVSGDPA